MTPDVTDSPEDVILETGTEVRCALATLVAIEALRREDEDVDWYEGTAGKMLGHFDNLLTCARTLADQHRALVDYIRHQTDTIEAGWRVKREERRAAREAEHATEKPAQP